MPAIAKGGHGAFSVEPPEKDGSGESYLSSEEVF
jgi:hypothetical protein